MTEHRWQGSALLRLGVLAFIGSIGATDRHAHHAVQIITATTALTVVDGTGVRHCGTKVIVPADAAHWIEAGAAAGSVVFLDPESIAGRAANHRSIRFGWTADPVLGHTRERPLAAVVADLMEQLTPIPAAEPAERHPAVLAALHLLPELAGVGAVRGTEVAAAVGVSVSRLTHLFTEQVGIPLRRYVLWLRLRMAITEVLAGADLTDAAHSAGFADSAHLTRTCRHMFGLPPSVLSRHVSWDIDDRG
jgi:AraC-like DNA-binding protein